MGSVKSPGAVLAIAFREPGHLPWIADLAAARDDHRLLGAPLLHDSDPRKPQGATEGLDCGAEVTLRGSAESFRKVRQHPQPGFRD